MTVKLTLTFYFPVSFLPVRTESSSGRQWRCEDSALSHLSPLHSIFALPATLLKRIGFENTWFVCKRAGVSERVRVYVCVGVCVCAHFFLPQKHKLMHNEVSCKALILTFLISFGCLSFLFQLKIFNIFV